MQMIDKFNEKLKQIVDEEQVTWYQLSCAPPDSHENIFLVPMRRVGMPSRRASVTSDYF